MPRRKRPMSLAARGEFWLCYLRLFPLFSVSRRKAFSFMNPPRPASPWPWIVLSALTLLIIGGGGLMLIGAVLGGGGVPGPSVGLIELSGGIADEGTGGLIGGASARARDVIEELDRARRDESVKAVVLRINSPGGSPAASHEIYSAVRRLGKPVICSMGDMAASGGYYVASACDKIYANPSTVTGSIGVISQYLHFSGLLRRFGAGRETIKSGKLKAIGSEARPLTRDERRFIQTQIREIYNQFVDAVATGRKHAGLTRAQIVRLADGRTYTGQQATRNKLIDSLGGLHEAVQEAGRRGGISGEPEVKKFSSGRSVLGALFGANANDALSREVGSASESAGRAAGQAFAETMMRQLKAEGNWPIAPQMR